MQDFSGYVDFYNNLDSFDTKFSGLNLVQRQIALITSSSGGFEPGFIYLNRIFFDLGFTALQFLTFITFFTNYFLLNFLSKYPRFTASLFFLISTQFFFQQGNLVRQMFAISILLNAIKYLYTRKLGLFALLVILASSIHVGSMIFMSVYFFNSFYIKRVILFIIWLCSVIIFYFPQLIPLDFGTFGIFFTKELIKNDSVGDLVHFNFIYNFVCLLFLISYEKISSLKEEKVLFLIFFVGVCLGNLVSISEWFYRISLYFLPTLIILLSKIYIPIKSIFRINSKNNQIIVYSVVFLFLLFYPFRFVIFTNTTAIGKEVYSISEFFRH